MQIVPPFFPVRSSALKILASSSMKTPGYAMNNLKEVTPPFTSASISCST